MTQPNLFGESLTKSAEFSVCGTYRYQLGRLWGAGRSPLGWIMLNPSTADADLDDPTIRRCMGFARVWGYDGILVGNLYALRSTDPSVLATHSDPSGPENHRWIGHIARTCHDVVCAWGAHRMATTRALSMVELVQANGAQAWCLGTTKGGHPRHPLYVKGDARAERYQPAVAS